MSARSRLGKAARHIFWFVGISEAIWNGKDLRVSLSRQLTVNTQRLAWVSSGGGLLECSHIFAISTMRRLLGSLMVSEAVAIEEVTVAIVEVMFPPCVALFMISQSAICSQVSIQR